MTHYLFSALVCFCSVVFAIQSPLPENASYKNLNPRPYDNCEATDLIKLSACCNDVLADLDDCKAGDLACECCALQKMDLACYNLCPGNPHTNFLSVLFDDCTPLNDVNACNMPFKRVDGDKPTSYKVRRVEQDASLHPTTSVKTQISGSENGVALEADEDNADAGEMQFKPRPILNLFSNTSNSSGMCNSCLLSPSTLTKSARNLKLV